MTKRVGRVLIIVLAVSGLTFYFSCTQPKDILTPVSRSDLYLWGNDLEPRLKPQNMPTNPDGMIYELWVVNDNDTASLGKFGYSQDSLKFYDENGNERPDSNHFALDGDIFHYSQIFVSIETNPDTLPESPGPIMLIDDVTDPSANQIKLRFPLSDSLWIAVAEFNMETPSDSDANANDGFGIWFSSYSEKSGAVRDTTKLDSVRLVYMEDSTLPQDTFTWWIDTIVNDTTYNIVGVYGLDTIGHLVVRFDSVLQKDTTWPYTVMVDKGVDPNVTRFFYTVGDSTTFTFENFSQIDYGIPNYSAYGWKYKGWIVSPEVPVHAVGKITLPAYTINSNPTDSLIPGIEGGLLTTGTFADATAPDDGNLYSLGPRVPPFPGEDFLTNLPFPASGWQGLLPRATGNSGTIFITLEPDNFVTDTTNFPLFVLLKPLPSSREYLQDYSDHIYEFTMKNLTPTNRLTDSFPMIVVEIERF